MSTRAYRAGVEAAIEKFAARRGVKEIRNAVMGGNLGRANQLAKTPGVLRQGNAFGSDIRHLGTGGEGIADLVAHPQHGVSVRKTYNPQGGVYSPEMIRRKEQIGSLPGVADFHGKATTRQNTAVHFNEYVPGKEATPANLAATPGGPQAYQKAMLQAQRAGKQKGYSLADLRGANAMIQPSGQVKFVDHMPFKPGEKAPNSVSRLDRKAGRASTLPTTADSAESLFLNNRTAPANSPSARKDPGAFRKMMFDQGSALRPSVPLGASSSPVPPRPVAPSNPYAPTAPSANRNASAPTAVGRRRRPTE